MAGQEEIASIQRRLVELDDERSKLVSRLEQLQDAPPAGLPQLAGVTNSSSVVDKIAHVRKREWELRCVSGPMGEPEDRPVRICAGMRQ